MSHEIFRTLPARSALLAASLLLGPVSAAHGDVTVTKDDGEAAATKKPGGSVVTYRNTIANAAGGVTATGVEFKDPDVANTTYVAGSLTLNGAPLTDAADGDAGAFALGPARIGVSLGDLTAASGPQTIVFRVTID